MNDLYLALHGVAIKKHAPAAAVAAVVGLPLARAEELLQQATASGRLVDAQSGYALTPAGRMILDNEYSRAYEDLRNDAAFGASYARFERVNTALKQLITDWQTLTIGGQQVRNDHSNAAHDAAVLDRLGALHESFEPVLAQLAGGLPRLTRYAAALTNALERAEAGATQWVSDARLDSYHTVWFELHEDLLRVLGRVREE